MGRTLSTYGAIQKCVQSLWGKTESERSLGRPRRRWEDNIKIDLREVVCDPLDWIDPAEDREQWRAYVRAVMTSGFLESQLVLLVSL